MPTDPIKPPRKRPLSPQNHKLFDAWNSASTGHQRNQDRNAGSTGWRDTRSLKLERQLRSGDCLRQEDHTRALAFDGIVSHTLEEDESQASKNSVEGAGEWRWVTDAEAKRSQMRVRDIRSFMGVSKRKAGDDELRTKKKKVENHVVSVRGYDVEDLESGASTLKIPSSLPSKAVLDVQLSSTSESTSSSDHSLKIFAGLTIFLNGSTLPLISDHKLKQLLVKHGAQVSLYMARKSVSHVIVGQPNTGNETALGAGGGLSARKLQQEISRGGWKSVKIISAEWALESIKAGKRLAESRFAVLNVASKGQQSVAGMFGRR